MKPETDWRDYRRRVALAPGITNLNAGSCSPTTVEAHSALERIGRTAAADPVDFLFRSTLRELEPIRHDLAARLGCDAAGLLLLNNVGYGVNTLARSMQL